VGQTYTAVRVGNETQAKLLSGGTDTGVAVPRRFKVTVFGQRELRQLGDGQASLRQFVISTSGDEWEKANTEEKQVREDLHDANARLERLETSVKRLEEKEADLADLKEKLEQARKGGAEELLKQGTALGAVNVKIQTALGWPSKVEASRVELGAHLPRPEVPAGDGVPDVIATELDKLAVTLGAVSRQLQREVAAVSAALVPARSSWENYVKTTSDTTTASLAALGISDAAELTKIQTMVAQLEADLSIQLSRPRRQHNRSARQSAQNYSTAWKTLRAANPVWLRVLPER
jgi:hypothetical protein